MTPQPGDSEQEVYLDVETLRLSDEVEGGWSSIDKFGLAVAVTWDRKYGFRNWFENDAKRLVSELEGWPRIVTFNGDRFDLTVLHGYAPVAQLRGKSLDLLADLYRILGHRVSLDRLAGDTLGRAKTGSGVDAVRWWRAGETSRVCEYCQRDVQLLVDLVAFARRAGHIVLDGRKIPVVW